MTSGQDLAGRTVLVTGADGFIGSHLVELLVARGAAVRAFVYYNSWNSLGWLADVEPAVLAEVEVMPGDIRDAERVAGAVNGCDLVFHLSSLIGIPYSYVAARSYVDTNIGGALNVLQACCASDRLERLVHTSTSEVYGTAQTVPISEDHPLVGQSPYSASKIGADKMAESFHLSFRLPVVTARPFNTFGPRQTARAVIPTVLSQLLAGGHQLRLGALSPTRDFNYVTDTAAGIVALGLCPRAEGRTVNIGTGEEWSIGEMAEMAIELVGRAVEIVSDEDRMRPEASEVQRLIADNRLIVELTGWQPTVPFRDGLARTRDWIAGNLVLFGDQGYRI